MYVYREHPSAFRIQSWSQPSPFRRVRRSIRSYVCHGLLLPGECWAVIEWQRVPWFPHNSPSRYNSHAAHAFSLPFPSPRCPSPPYTIWSPRISNTDLLRTQNSHHNRHHRLNPHRKVPKSIPTTLRPLSTTAKIHVQNHSSATIVGGMRRDRGSAPTRTNPPHHPGSPSSTASGSTSWSSLLSCSPL
ncbi:uncharacterized protein BKA78DRAFT_313408 [Phyllosticta capitalensis]|uniref:uncharacterized protein n=1 Tax=Phyllosticta capitalensis TaxID=121624 RepID=UPI00312E4856